MAAYPDNKEASAAADASVKNRDLSGYGRLMR
jgi:hypothetical protein